MTLVSFILGIMKSTFINNFILVTAAILFFDSCQNATNNDSNTQAQNNLARQIFLDSNNEFIVKVVYEIGATPYTGTIGLTTNETWDITQSSYQAIFQNHVGRVITVPKTVGAFTQISDQGKTTWTASELIALGASVSPDTVVTNNKATVTVVFVNGLFEGNSGILGVHFSGYSFAFVFKDVVTSVGGTPIDQRYVEQGTIVHELGHVIGFVNNGVPLTSNYHDQAHPKHSLNSNCVMYWTVESSSTILGFLTNTILANRLNLFEAEVLNDAGACHQ